MPQKYKSKYGRKTVTAAQYITEILCERKAAFVKTQLPLFFWKDKEWFGYYMFQLKLINKLIKKYGEQALFKVITDNPTLFSARHTKIDEWCLYAKRILDHTDQKPSFIAPKESIVGKTFRPSSTLDNL